MSPAKSVTNCTLCDKVMHATTRLLHPQHRFHVLVSWHCYITKQICLSLCLSPCVWGQCSKHTEHTSVFCVSIRYRGKVYKEQFMSSGRTPENWNTRIYQICLFGKMIRPWTGRRRTSAQFPEQKNVLHSCVPSKVILQPIQQPLHWS
jgi:hypothetical protein